MKKNPEFERFDALMGQLLKVSHGEIKRKLNAEKKSKQRKKDKKAKSK